MTVGYEGAERPASSSTRSESSLLVGSMIRASTRAANTWFSPEATSSPNAVNAQVKASVKCRIRVEVIGNAAPGRAGEPT